MTRETKLGLGVATSFLSLVAVVAYNSWNKTDDPPPAPEAPPPGAVAQLEPGAKNEIKSATPVKPAAFNDGRSGPASQEPPPYPVLESTPGPTPSGGVSLPAPPPSFEAIKPDVAVSPINPTNTGQAPPVHPLPTNQGTIEIPPPVDLAVPSPVVQQPKAPPSPPDPVGPRPPSGEMTAKGPAASDAKLDPGAASSNPGVPLPGYPAVPPSNGMPLPANPIPTSSNPIPTPVNPVVAPPGPNPMTGNPTPVTGNPTPVPPGPAPMAGNPTPVPPGPALAGANPNPLPPTNPNPLPPEPKQIGQGVTSPPIAIPAGPTAAAAAQVKPQVESFNERRYICQPTDTDFAAVSKQNYNSEKYGQALMLYNRDHPVGRAAVQQGLQLQPGAEVYVPPLYVLESKYGNAIPNLTPLPQNGQRSPDVSAPPKAMVPVVQGPPTASPMAPGSAAPAPSVVPPPAGGLNTPQPPPAQPAVPNGPTNVPPTGPVQNLNTANAGQYKLYAVPAGGQQFYEIARDTLGDGNRWSEIYQLNQQYDPQLMVPAGTQLKLPPEAYVRQ
jgi:hypothetical protein